MRKSTRLCLADIEACFDLIQECRELWADPPAWRLHLLQGMCRLTGQAVGHYVEMDPLTLDGGPVRFTVMADYGWRDDAARSHFLRYSQDMSGAASVPFPGIEKLFMELFSTGHAIAFRQETSSDAEWYGSKYLNDFRRPAFNDGFVMSFIAHPATGRCSQLGVHQDPSDPQPNLRSKRIIELVHRRLMPLVDDVLANEQHRSRMGLTPRLNQTLDRLLEGDSEKEIAVRLHLSPATIHEYVGKLYRHFGASSHPELMAYFLRRRPVRGMDNPGALQLPC